MMVEALRTEGITKTFPGVVANDRIDLEVKEGEVHAILGENGAGKSVLMGVISGIYQPDSGKVFVYGRELRISSPRVAMDAGIGMVHQHFMLFPPLTIFENIMVGVEPWRNWYHPDRGVRERVSELARRYGFEVDLDARVRDVSVGIRQRVEILKTLYRGARILILDEPSAVLTPQEVDHLVTNLETLVSEGLSVIFITHKLDEVMKFADRVTVLRNGRVVSTLRTADADVSTLARMMVGRDVVFRVERPPGRPGRRVLEVEDVWALGDRGEQAVRGVTFDVREGEIFGVAGVDGNGQRELAEVIYGLRRTTRGRVEFLGRNVTSASTMERRHLGMRAVPDDRALSLVPAFSITENVGLGCMGHEGSRTGVMRWGDIDRYARELMGEFSVTGAGPNTSVAHLSGGNQQKVIMALAISPDPKLLLVAQATRGLDVGATEYVRRKLIECRTRGMAILLFSTDLDEVLSVSDRVGVMFRGRLQGIVPQEEADRESIGAMMAGASLERGGSAGAGTGGAEGIET